MGNAACTEPGRDVANTIGDGAITCCIVKDSALYADGGASSLDSWSNFSLMGWKLRRGLGVKMAESATARDRLAFNLVGPRTVNMLKSSITSILSKENGN